MKDAINAQLEDITDLNLQAPYTAALLDTYINTRNQTEHLCAPLNVEDYVPQAAEFASPPKWHLAHTTWFFEEMILKPFLPNYKIFDASFNQLFNSYYQSAGDPFNRAARGIITRPGVAKVYEYRKYVDEHMRNLLTSPLSDKHQDLMTLGINHEQQHQELLLTDLKYAFSLNPTHPIYKTTANLVADQNKQAGWLRISEGIYNIGHDGSDFCYDNELGAHKVYTQDYEISKALVTNAEFMAFIEDGGYEKFELWLDEGWSWVKANHISNPLYWQKLDGQWFTYTLAGLKPVEAKAMVSHISYYEAAAFAAWSGCRLPTEFEWEIAADQLGWGQRWEWTSSPYIPYPGFAISDGAVGEYNGKFMVNQIVLRGGSVTTTKGHSRKTYRNFFHPHFQWQYSGLRLAR